MANVSGADDDSKKPTKFKETRAAKMKVLEAVKETGAFKAPNGTGAKRLKQMNDLLANHRDDDFPNGFTMCGKTMTQAVAKWIEDADDGNVDDPAMERLIGDVKEVVEDNLAVQEARDEQKKEEVEQKARLDALADQVRDLLSQNMNPNRVPRSLLLLVRYATSRRKT